MEADVAEFYHRVASGRGRIVKAASKHHRIGVKHLAHAARGRRGTGNGLEYHCNLHQRENYLRDVSDRRHDNAGVHTRKAAAYPDAADKYQRHDGEIENEIKNGRKPCHKRHNAQVCVAQVAVGAVKALALVVLADVSFDDTRARNVLLNHGVHLVKPCLHYAEQRDGFF